MFENTKFKMLVRRVEFLENKISQDRIDINDLKWKVKRLGCKHNNCIYTMSFNGLIYECKDCGMWLKNFKDKDERIAHEVNLLKNKIDKLEESI